MGMLVHGMTAPQQFVASSAPGGAPGTGIGGIPATPNPFPLCHTPPTGRNLFVSIAPSIALHINSIVSIGGEPSPYYYGYFLLVGYLSFVITYLVL